MMWLVLYIYNDSSKVPKQDILVPVRFIWMPRQRVVKAGLSCSKLDIQGGPKK